MIYCRGPRAPRWVAGGVRPTIGVVGGVHRTQGHKHQDPEVVREKVKSGSMPAACGAIHDGIER